MGYPNRDELVRMGVTVFIVYLGIYYWDAISGWLVLLLSALSPVLMGCVIAYIANVPMSFFEQHLSWMGASPRLQRLRRPLALLISIMIGCVMAAVLLRFIMPELMQSVRMMSQKLPLAVEAVREVFREFDLEAMVDEQLNQLSDWDKIQMQVSSYLMSGAGGVMGSFVSSISTALSSTFDMLLSAILAIYILMSKEQLGVQFGRLLETYCGKKVLDRAVYVGRVLDHSFSSFIIGRCISSLILGMLCVASMLLLRLPYSMTIGTVVGVTNIVPVVGPFVGGIIGVLLIFSTSTIDSLVFLGLVLILQQIDANVVFPRVVGSSTGLPGIWVLAAVAVGAGLGGVPFVLLSVPVAASIYTLVSDDLELRMTAADEATEDKAAGAAMSDGSLAAGAAELVQGAANLAAAAAELVAGAVDSTSGEAHAEADEAHAETPTEPTEDDATA